MLCRALKEPIVVHKVPNKNKENCDHTGNSGDRNVVDLIIVRVTKSKTKPFGLAKPCIDCMNSLKGFNSEHSDLVLRFIYYTDDNGVLKKDHINNLKSTHICHGSRLRKCK